MHHWSFFVREDKMTLSEDRVPEEGRLLLFNSVIFSFIFCSLGWIQAAKGQSSRRLIFIFFAWSPQIVSCKVKASSGSMESLRLKFAEIGHASLMPNWALGAGWAWRSWRVQDKHSFTLHWQQHQHSEKKNNNESKDYHNQINNPFAKTMAAVNKKLCVLAGRARWLALSIFTLPHTFPWIHLASSLFKISHLMLYNRLIRTAKTNKLMIKYQTFSAGPPPQHEFITAAPSSPLSLLFWSLSSLTSFIFFTYFLLCWGGGL